MSFLVSSFFGRFAKILLSHRALSAALFALGMLAVLSGALRLRVDFSAKAFFSGDKQKEQDLDAYHAAWGDDDHIVAVVGQRKGKGSVLDSDARIELDRLSKALAAVEGVAKVVGLSTLPVPVDKEGIQFLPTTAQAPPPGLESIKWQARVLGDANLVPALLSSDAKATAIAVELDRKGDDIGAIRPVVEVLQKLVAAQKGPIVWSLAGTPVVRAGLLALILHDQAYFVPLSFLLMALLLALLFRRAHGVVLPLLGALIPSAMVMGVMGFLDEPIGIVNQVYFTLLPVIAVSGGIHLLSRYYEEADRRGTHADTLLPTDRLGALHETLRAVGGACFFSSLTTVIGLLSLQASGMQVLKSFGLYSAIGVGFAFLTLIILTPLILSVTRGRILDPAHQAGPHPLEWILMHAASFALRRPRLCVGTAGLLLALGLMAGRSVIVDNSLSGMLRPDHPTSQAGAVLDQKLGGLLTLEIDLKGGPSAFVRSDVLQALRDFSIAARRENAVRTVTSPATVIAGVNGVITGKAAIPADNNAISQLYLIAAGTDVLQAVVNDRRDQARMVVRTRDIGGRRFEALANTLQHDLTTRLSKVGGQVKCTFTGTTLVSYLGVNRLVEDLRASVLLAFLVIIAIIALIFRSVRVGLLAILPNALPLALGYGLVGVLGWKLEPGTAVVFTVALGIAVDDTIHLLTRTAEEEHNGRSRQDALRTAIRYSGRPVVITTVILTAGFAINMLSAFPTNAMAGLLGAFVIFTALLADIFVLPPLLLLVGPSKLRAEPPSLRE